MSSRKFYFREAKQKSIYASNIDLKMSLENRKLRELQISDDLREAFDLYQLQDLVTVGEVQEGMEQVRLLGREFRHIHIELKLIMEEPAYAGEFPEVTELSEQVKQYLRDGKTKVRELEKVEAEAQVKKLAESKEREDMDTQARAKVKFGIEESTFNERLKYEVDNFPVTDVGEIKKSCEKFEFLLGESYKLLSSAKLVFGAEFDDEAQTKFDTTISLIREKISEGYGKIREISDEIQEELAHNKAAEEEQSKKAFLSEQKCL